MVSGVRISTEFNEFFPRGDFRGYKAALAAHYGAEFIGGHPSTYLFTSDRPLDGDGNPYERFGRYTLDVTEKFHSELGPSGYHRPPLLPVLPHEWPTEYVYERSYKRHASIAMFPNRMYAVEEGLRDVIERLEPGVHQFNPIRVLLPKGVEHPVRYHMMVVGRWLNSFRLDQSDPSCLLKKDTSMPMICDDNRKYYGGVALAASAIGDAHLWCERALMGATFYISDVLKEAADKAGLRLPPHYKMKSV